MSSALQVKSEDEVLAADGPGEIRRILLIDDDPAYCHLLRRFLAKDTSARYEIVVAPNASAGITACESQSFDCLLIDYTLPDLTGTELISNLSSIHSVFTPPAIILTADGGEEAAAEAVRAGASDYMPKQAVSAQSLSRAIGNAIEKSRLKNSVENRSRDLERANEALQSKSDEIQRFYHTVSHEVKTPLAATREFIAIVLDGIAGPVTEEQVEMLTYAIDSCDQLTAHFNDLVEMTRLEARKISLKKKVGSLEGVITRCLASIASPVEAKNITLSQQIESPLPLVLIDGNRVIQVLSNLLGNAIKYTEMNGSITLSISHALEDGFVHISVADTGCGISKTDLPHVFDRLYQVEEGGDELMGAGLGLGLSIAKEIVALHGGDIWVESVYGEGSTFTFRLPVAHSIFDNPEG